MTQKILVTGSSTGQRQFVERTLFEGWRVEAWTESAKGFACVVVSDTAPGVEVTPQRDALAAEGYGGIRYPSSDDIIRAAFALI